MNAQFFENDSGGELGLDVTRAQRAATSIYSAATGVCVRIKRRETSCPAYTMSLDAT